MRPGRFAAYLAVCLQLCASGSAAAQPPRSPRARDLGVPFAFGAPGRENAITDVAGVLVGHTTLVEGDSVRTGVTAILPRGRGDAARTPCFGAVFSLNGNGEMTGAHWVRESGIVEGPIVLTNTNAVGVVRDAIIDYAARRWPPQGDGWTVWSLPIVAETWDGTLNDIYGHHVKAEHLAAAIDGAASGPVAEGGVGGGTGMICYEYKGGIGTASRVLAEASGGYRVGVLVQANHGVRHQLRIAGLPVGLELRAEPERKEEAGSIILAIGTDAPLLPHQLERLCRRAALGLARTGSVAGNGSGDIFIAFSTANAAIAEVQRTVSLEMLPNERMNALFEATVGATEEAIVNALVAGRTTTGFRGRRVPGLPLDRVRDILKRHGLLEPAARP
jgi:D-aminopeptidase